MILAFASAANKNANFNIALDRTFNDWKVLRSNLDTINVDGRFNTLGFVIADRPPNYFKVAPKADDSIYQVVVGYNLTSEFRREEDDKVVTMMADWLRRAFQESDGYAAKRTELIGIVNSWEEESINRILSQAAMKT
jgi:hypothetical protein